VPRQVQATRRSTCVNDRHIAAAFAPPELKRERIEAVRHP
jgi:hypothetical protein